MKMTGLFSLQNENDRTVFSERVSTHLEWCCHNHTSKQKFSKQKIAAAAQAFLIVKEVVSFHSDSHLSFCSSERKLILDYTAKDIMAMHLELKYSAWE